MEEQDLAVDDFKRWLGRNDVNTYGVAIENSTTAPHSRGLFTSDALSCANDDVLADVPSRLLISYSLVERISNEGKGVAASRLHACLCDMRRQHGHRFQTKPNRERIYIITFLVWLAYNADQEASEEAGEFWTPSYWRPYYQILPNMERYDTVLLWPTDTLALLAGTDLDTAACAKRQTLRREYEELHACLLKLPLQGDVSWERYLWADQVFWSRVLDLGTAFACEGIASKGDDYHLVPLIDFCNHSFDIQIRWHVAATDDDWKIELRTTNAEPRTFQAGTELFISYGDKPNAELFFVYNFAVQDNPYDSIRVRPPFIEDGMPDDDVKEGHEVETEVADSGLSPLSVQDKIAFMKALDLPSQLELRTVSREEYADDLTKGLLSREALLIMYICVLTADDGFCRVNQQEQQDDIEGPKYTLQDMPIWPATQETFKHFVESLPHFEVIQLRVWAVLLQVVTYRLGMLSEVQVQQHLEEPADDLHAARLSTIQTLRTSAFHLLVDALTLLQELQEQWAELEVVQQYLESMQLAD